MASPVPPAEGARPASELPPGAWQWQAQAQDRIRVRLQFAPASKIEVDIWWNHEGGFPDVQLIFGLYPGSVELGSLRGNGFNAPALHRVGFGTLAVNVAVQALRATCDKSWRVEGILSNTDEIGLPAAQRADLEAGRRAFWRRFGLDVVRQGEPPYDYLQGRVADLHTVDHGLVAGQFARRIPLSSFERC